MVIQLHPLSRRAIVEDLQVVAGFLLSPDYEEIRSIYVMGTFPYLSLVLRESIEHLGLQLDQLGLSDSSKARLLKGRHQTKILASAPLAVQIAEVFDLSQAYRAAFANEHSSRRLASLWQGMQPDLGLYFRGGVFITNTFTLHQDLGFLAGQALSEASKQHAIQQLLYEESVQYGQVLAAIASAMQIDFDISKTDASSTEKSSEPFYFRDVRSSEWLGSAQKRLESGQVALGYLLINVLSRIQLATSFAENFAADSPWVEFKVKMIYSYHAIASIGRIIGYDVNHVILGPESRVELRSIAGLSSSRAIRSMKSLRNFAVHYGLDFRLGSQLADVEDFDDLIRTTSQFESLEEALEVADRNLREISVRLSQYFDLRPSRTRIL